MQKSDAADDVIVEYMDRTSWKQAEVRCTIAESASEAPARVRLIEMGPGRGTLMADMLRSTAIFPPFHAALQVDLVEVSLVAEPMQPRARFSIIAAAARAA